MALGSRAQLAAQRIDGTGVDRHAVPTTQSSVAASNRSAVKMISDGSPPAEACRQRPQDSAARDGTPSRACSRMSLKMWMLSSLLRKAHRVEVDTCAMRWQNGRRVIHPQGVPNCRPGTTTGGVKGLDMVGTKSG